MRKKEINDTRLVRLIDGGLTQADAARELGVSRQAVSKRLQELRGKTTKVIATKKIERVVDQRIDAVEQLQKINEYANELLDLCMRWQRGDDEAIQVLESQLRKIRVGQDEKIVEEIKLKDPRQLALKAMSEIRGQLKLQLEIFQTLYDMKAVAEFQEEILTAIDEVAPDVRRKIIESLNQRRAIQSVVRFN